MQLNSTLALLQTCLISKEWNQDEVGAYFGSYENPINTEA